MKMMKLNFRNILIASAALLVAVSCNKEQRPGGNIVSPIALTATEAGTTKALLDNGTFAATGNRLQIYDFVDNAQVPYINDRIGPDVEGSPLAENTYGVWPFENGPHQWTPGVHKFFGWLDTDAKMTAPNNTPLGFFGDGFVFSSATQVLTVPAKKITYATPQFDFMYSDIKVTQPTNDAVALKFYHLFTAVSIGVENSTSSFVDIEGFSIEGIPCQRSASIDFSSSDLTGTYMPNVTYSNFADGVTFTRGLDAGIDIPYTISPRNLRSNIFNGSTTQEFMMLWPVDASQLHSTDKTTTTDGVVKYPDTWKMYIKYIADGKTYEKRINFPNISWEAGKKYHLTIVFADKMVELRTEVKPWEYEDQTIDYTKEGVSVGDVGALAWNRTVSSVDDAAKTVSIVNAQPAQAMFTIQTPIGGSWIVSLVGDVNAFEVSPSTGIIDSQTATVHVRPLVSSPTRDYKVQLKFTVRRSDGRMIAADNIIQANGTYTVVLPRNN